MSRRIREVQRVLDAPGLKKVEDPLEVRKLLDRAISTEAKVTFQRSGAEDRFQSNITERSVIGKNIYIRAPDDFDLKIFEQTLEEAGTKECSILIFLQGQLLIGMAAPFLGLDPYGLSFQFPTSVFKIQKRKDARFYVPAGYDLTVQMDAMEGARRRVRKKMMDISAGGLAFHVVSQREAALFRKGMTLRNLRFTLQAKDFETDAEVCSQTQLGTDSAPNGMKIGVQFLGLSEGDANLITSYVLSRVGHAIL